MNISYVLGPKFRFLELTAFDVDLRFFSSASSHCGAESLAEQCCSTGVFHKIAELVAFAGTRRDPHTVV